MGKYKLDKSSQVVEDTNYTMTQEEVCERLNALEEKVNKTHKFLKVLTDMVFEKDLVAKINWSGANQEICCRYLKELGYVKLDEDNCYVKVYKTFGRDEDE